MAKSDITMKFDAATGNAVQQMLLAAQSLQNGADKARQFGDAASDSGKKAEEGFKRMVLGSAGVLGVITSITGAFAALKEVISKTYEEEEKKAGKIEAHYKTLSDALASRGQIQNLPAVNAFINAQSRGRVTRDEGTEIYKSIYESMGTRATPDQVAAAYKASMRAVDSGQSPDSAAILGKTNAELQVSGALKGKTQADAQEVAAFLQQRVPEGLDEGDWRIVAHSKDKVKTLDAIIAGKQTHERSKELASLEQQAGEDIDPVKIAELKKIRNRKTFTAEDARILRNADISPDDRFEAWIADPTLAPPEHRALLENLKANQSPYVENAMVSKPLAVQQAENYRLRVNDKDVRATYEKRQAELNLDVATQQGEADAAHESAVRTQDTKNMVGVGIPEWLAETLAYMNWAEQKGLNVLGSGAFKNFGSRPDVEKQLQSIRPDSISPSGGDVHGILKSIDNSLSQMNDLHQRVLKPNTTLSNDNAGQK